MGQTHSKRSRQFKSAPPSYSEVSIIKPFSNNSSQLDSTVLNAFEKDFDTSINKLSQTVLVNSGMRNVLLNREAVISDKHVFNNQLALEGSITNQKSSGRCWIFAATNIMRLGLMKKYNLDHFELSQSFVFFFDKLEKANHYLEKVIELSPSNDIDSRLFQTLSWFPVNDGGQWDMLYGVCPQAAFPESHHSSNSGELNWVVTKKLREYAVILRRILLQEGKSPEEARQVKIGMMNEIYKIIAICLGEPPKVFDWEFRDKNMNYFSFNGLTPKAFYEQHIKASLGSGENTGVGALVSLVNDPRHPYYRTMTVEHLGNVIGGHKVPIDVMKEATVASLESGNPVWFGCDVGKFYEGHSGLMDLNTYNYAAAFGVDVVNNMTKAERLQYNESLMTHAMVFTGVHLTQNQDGSVSALKWRVENSWGESTGDKGFNVMSDDWFSEYTYQVVIDSNTFSDYLRQMQQRAFNDEVIVLPLWDPLGSLALI